MRFLPVFLATAAALRLGAAAETPLTVAAATSLRDVLTEIKTLYALDHADVAVALTFSGSGMIQREIEKGVPVDVFVSASPREIFALEKKDLLLRDSIRNVVRNTLVLIVAKDNTAIQTWTDLARPEVQRIAIGEPRKVSAGTYATETFAFLKLTDTVAPKLLKLTDVRAVLAQVGSGAADAGVVYATDARRSDTVRVAANADAKMHQMILYPCGIPRASKQQAAARDFIAFLVSEPARAVFAKHGFLAPH